MTCIYLEFRKNKTHIYIGATVESNGLWVTAYSKEEHLPLNYNENHLSFE